MLNTVVKLCPWICVPAIIQPLRGQQKVSMGVDINIMHHTPWNKSPCKIANLGKKLRKWKNGRKFPTNGIPNEETTNVLGWCQVTCTMTVLIWKACAYSLNPPKKGHLPLSWTLIFRCFVGLQCLMLCRTLSQLHHFSETWPSLERSMFH